MELTTKVGLCKNLGNSTNLELKVEKMFPRCYDLSDTKQIDAFVSDFRQTGMFSLIR